MGASSIPIPDEAVELAALMLQPAFRRWGVQGDGEVTARDALTAALPSIRSSVLESVVESVAKAICGAEFPGDRWSTLNERQRDFYRDEARRALGLPSEGEVERG